MSLQTLDLTIIADRNCVTSGTYLAYLKHYGFKPSRVILCDFLYEPQLFTWKDKLRYRLSEKLYKHYAKPHKITIPEHIKEYCHEIQSSFDVKVTLDLDQVVYEDYCDNIVAAPVWNYKDRALQEILFQNKDTHYLYTGGGIVPQNIFDNNVKILHIHPGIVPYVRGSDGVLWSLIERKKLGYSCFYMNAGIDTGNLIMQKEYDQKQFPTLQPLYEENASEIYYAILLSYDPHFRARLLGDVINHVNGDLHAIKAIPQDLSTGNEFFSMHPELVKQSIKKFF